MDYILKRYYIYQEFRKLKTGHFSFDSPQDCLRARYLCDIQDILQRIQHQGIILGLCLVLTSGYPASLSQAFVITLITREIATYYYTEEIFSYLELDRYMSD